MILEMIDFLEEKIKDLHEMFSHYGDDAISHRRYVNEVNAYQEIIDYLKGQL